MISTPSKRSKRSPTFWVIVSIVFVIILARIYYRATDDFRLGNITYELPHHKEWEIPPLNQKEKSTIEAILAQKFSYLGKGAQCYAFSSEDNQYVLKFFKFKHLKPHWFVEILPPIFPFSRYRIQQSTRKQRKLDGLFEGYRLAYEAYRPESGLIYIHLNKTNNIFKNIIVYDKIGLQRTIDLDSVVFIIQKKGTTTRAVLTEDLNNQNVVAAKEHIGKIFDLYASEYKRGIFDKDHGVLHNTGFVIETPYTGLVNEAPFHLDVGKLTRNDSLKNDEAALKDITLISNKFKIWIKLHYPQYFQELAQEIDRKKNALYGIENPA